jgi:hypothetical protein
MPNTPHGVSTTRELELLAQAGLPPSAVLIAATANSARAMKVLDDRGTIEKGKRADIVLIRGKPWQDIRDVEKIDRVLIDGAVVFGSGGRALNRVVPPPAVPVANTIADFERSDGRTNLDTLVVTYPDTGLDRSVEEINVIPRSDGGHALMMMAKMSIKDEPYASVIIPLTKGSVFPADLRRYKGVKIDIRGQGAYELRLNSFAGVWHKDITGADQWRSIEVPFSDLKLAKVRVQFPSTAWTGDNVTEIDLRANGKSGQKVWLEIDNVGFY